MKRILTVSLLAMLTIAVFTGCRFVVRDGGLSIAGTQYNVDDRSEQDVSGVTDIRIADVSGQVTLLAGGDKAVAELKGSCRATNDPVWLDARREGSTLVFEVKYPNTISYNDTRLTVTIPAEYAGDLSASSVSGDIRAEALPQKFGQVRLHTVSGGIRFGAAAFESLSAESISGGVTLANIAAPVNATTTSGDVDITYTAAARTDVSSISGSVTASLPKDSAFRVEFHSVSGRFRSNHPGIGAEDAKGGFTAAVSGGTELIKVSTTSGGFRLED